MWLVLVQNFRLKDGTFGTRWITWAAFRLAKDAYHFARELTLAHPE